MDFKRILIPFGLCGLVAAVPASGVVPGVQVGGADTRIAISGIVPVICRAQVAATQAAVAPGVQQLGQLREFCNSPRGYRVVATYSPSLVNAKLLVDGVPVPLVARGETVVSRSPQAAIRNRDVALDLGKHAAPGAISFRIEPL